MLIALLMQVTFYVVLALLVFARGGNHLDIMKLLGANDDGLIIPKLVYVAGILWEELTKVTILVVLLRGISPVLRSVNSFLLPGLLFGFVEGVFGACIGFLGFDPLQNVFVTAATFAIYGSSMLSVMLGHSILMLVYGRPLLRGRLAQASVLVSLTLATALHLAYNAFIAPGQSGWAVDDGINATFSFAATLCIAVIVFPLRRYAMTSAAWQAAAAALPFVSPK